MSQAIFAWSEQDIEKKKNSPTNAAFETAPQYIGAHVLGEEPEGVRTNSPERRNRAIKTQSEKTATRQKIRTLNSSW